MRNLANSGHAEKYKRIGFNIALYRKLKGLTQIELAEIVGVSRTHMSNIEAPNMVTPLSMELVFNIAEALDIPVHVLFVMD